MNTAHPRAQRSRTGLIGAILTFLTLVGLVTVPATAATAMSSPPTYVIIDGIRYGFNPDRPDDGATVQSYDEAHGTEPTILDTVEIWNTSLPVTSIKEWTFYNKGLTAVTIPDTVGEIGTGAFMTNALSTINLPDSMMLIGYGAFFGNALTSLTLPDSVVGLGQLSFGSNRLQEVQLSSALTEIPQSAFINNAFSSITIPASVEEIGNWAFDDNDALSIVLLEGNAPEITPADASIGAGSFGPAAEKLLVYSACATGFSSPTWQGYATADTLTQPVTFMSAGGSEIEPLAVGHGCALEAPADPTRDGYTFAGWTVDAAGETAYDFDTRVTGPLTLYATWTPLPTHTVTFNTVGGSPIDPVEVTEGSPLTAPENPARDGYTFTGWQAAQSGGEAYDFARPVTESFTLYAAWERITHTVTFDTTGGTPIDPVIVNSGDPVNEPKNPSREGFAFAGWETAKTDGTEYDFATEVTADLTLYAAWAPVKKVTPTPSPGPGITPGAPQLPRTGGPSLAGFAWGGAGVFLAGLTLLTIRRARALRTGAAETSELLS